MNYQESIAKAKERAEFVKKDIAITISKVTGQFSIGMAWDHLTYNYDTMQVVAVVDAKGELHEKEFTNGQLLEGVA